jgi:lysozyme
MNAAAIIGVFALLAISGRARASTRPQEAPEPRAVPQIPARPRSPASSPSSAPWGASYLPVGEWDVSSAPDVDQWWTDPTVYYGVADDAAGFESVEPMPELPYQPFEENFPVPEQIDPDANLSAFLAMIRRAEGTDRRGDPYRVCYGFAHSIVDMSDHPAITGEWNGERLPDAMCRAAGKAPGCVSTAAGAYQFIRPTWESLKAAGKVWDFSPASQDAGAIALIDRAGAIGAVRSGDLATAVQRCAKTWASLPGAGYDQPERRFDQLAQWFTDEGGVIV